MGRRLERVTSVGGKQGVYVDIGGSKEVSPAKGGTCSATPGLMLVATKGNTGGCDQAIPFKSRPSLRPFPPFISVTIAALGLCLGIRNLLSVSSGQ